MSRSSVATRKTIPVCEQRLVASSEHIHVLELRQISPPRDALFWEKHETKVLGAVIRTPDPAIAKAWIERVGAVA